MSFERVKAACRTLRFRLMLWNGGAVILTGLAVLVSVREGVRYTLLYDMDQVLSEDVEEMTLNFQGEGDYHWDELLDQLNRKARGHKYHGWFVEFSDAAGKVVWSSVNSPEGLQIPRLVARQQDDPDIATVDGFRLAYARLPLRARQAASVCVGCMQSFVERDMSSIDRLVLFCGSIVLLVSPLGGYVLALRATRPLADITQTTARLRPQELQERLPVRGTGDELDHLALTINGLLDRIADYLDQKHDFLANAAHELRTPLAAIRSSVEVALGGERTIAEYNELLGEVIDECTALESLVNQLLLLAETDADRLRSHGDVVVLDLLVRKTLDMFQGVAEFNGIRLRAGHFPSTVIEGNRHHLRQVLNNVLDNAIKFTAAKHHGDEDSPGLHAIGTHVGDGGVIVVLLNQDRVRNVALVQIRDNGPGIPADQLPHVFERFYRVDRSRTRDRAVGGTGLGLSICQAIIAAHQGTISATSVPGEGTTFTIELPLAPAALQPELLSRIAGRYETPYKQGAVMDAAKQEQPSLARVYSDGFVPPALAEECANSATHGLGFALSVFGGIVLLQRAFASGTPAVIVACGIYVAALLGVYGASTLSHVFQAPELKRRLRKWDQGLIYLLIVATYTPLAVAYFGGLGLALFLVLVWTIAAVGFLSKVVWKYRVGQISTLTYVLLGWLPALAVKPALELMPSAAVWWVVAGGLCYTVGVLFMLLDGRVRFFHAVWHLWVIAGSACHYLAILWYVA